MPITTGPRFADISCPDDVEPTTGLRRDTANPYFFDGFTTQK